MKDTIYEDIKATLRIHVQTPEGPKEKSVTVKQGADLYALSNERASYRDGFEAAEINAEPSAEYLRCGAGTDLGPARRLRGRGPTL